MTAIDARRIRACRPSGLALRALRVLRALLRIVHIAGGTVSVYGYDIAARFGSGQHRARAVNDGTDPAGRPCQGKRAARDS